MFEYLIGLGQQLGAFKYLKDKLIARPDEAAKAFSEVLEELSKTFKALDDEITNYLCMWFDNEDRKAIEEQRKTLIGLEGGNVRVNMAKARGHCSKIDSIYEKYMNTWLQDIDSNKKNEIQTLFNRLSGADSLFITATEDLAIWIENQATQTLDYLGRQDFPGANQQISQARNQIVSTRRELARVTTELYQHNADFIKTTHAL